MAVDRRAATKPRRYRLWVGFAVAIAVGILLGVTHAPLWAALVAVAVLCSTVLPWAMIGDRRG